VPEFFENELGEALAARTESLATFRELGPPDLCHIIKTNPKSQVKEVGSYHYVLGTDASSSATLAAYLNSLIYTIEESQGWFSSSKSNIWKIKSGTYCCFNAFSRVDVRVDVRIPGGVDSYMVDLRGERHAISNPAIWQETAVSAVLRAILDDNDEADGNDGQPLLGLRKLDPLPTPAAERRFLEMAKGEFWKGWQLGTEPEVQVATFFSNHLTNGVLKYFSESGRMSEAVKFFEPHILFHALNLYGCFQTILYLKDPEVGAVLAKACLGTDEEIKAVQTLYNALKKRPLSYGLLLVQIDFLKAKGKLDMALRLAKLAVTYAPSEYLTWAKLTDIYIEMGDFESALLSLNSCPMFTYCEKDAHRMPPPARTHLPLKPEQATSKDTSGADDKKAAGPPLSGTIFDDNDPRENEVHPELSRLPALSLRGTFLKAYKLLIRIVTKVGWDELLRYRSTVFVMEEEYRIHRALVEETDKDAEGPRPNGEDPDEILDEKPYAPPMEPLDGDEDEFDEAVEQQTPEVQRDENAAPKSADVSDMLEGDLSTMHVASSATNDAQQTVKPAEESLNEESLDEVVLDDVPVAKTMEIETEQQQSAPALDQPATDEESDIRDEQPAAPPSPLKDSTSPSSTASPRASADSTRGMAPASEPRSSRDIGEMRGDNEGSNNVSPSRSVAGSSPSRASKDLPRSNLAAPPAAATSASPRPSMDRPTPSSADRPSPGSTKMSQSPIDHETMERVSLDSNRSHSVSGSSPTKRATTSSPATAGAGTSASPTKVEDRRGLSIDDLMRRAEAEQQMESVNVGGGVASSGMGKRNEEERSVTKTKAPFEFAMIDAPINNNFGEMISQNPRPAQHNISFTFKNKRLCEKWLDNLFMVLYNDLRLYTALKQEITQFKNAAGANPNVLLYRKTGAEWEIYADLALRLEHREDAKEAYRLCLEQKFSVKSWLKILELCAEDGLIQPTLVAVVRLVTMLDRAYVEHTYPSPIARGLFKLIRRHGLAKVQNALISMNIPQKQYRLITRFFEYCELFQ
ncbi:hypothetical protein HK102_005007, partial [Quaeritorhiza haematococci]